MKDYAKVGGKEGKPAYRTPSDFRRQLKYSISKSKQSKQKSYGQSFQKNIKSQQLQGKGFRGGR